jgi:trimeric autotransporter adhesin
MKSTVQLKTATAPLLIALALVCFAVVPRVHGVSPAPGGCYPGFTTAEGCSALNSLTTGAGNTGLGWRSLFFDTTGNYNTGVGGGALVLNNADDNTAVGAAAMLLNTGGHDNTAVGTDALVHNDSGNFNTANGAFALFSNTAANRSTAVGYQALFSNDADSNTAVGYQALGGNLGGLENTAIGDQALLHNTGGFFNVGIGGAALLSNMTGNDNTSVGGGSLNDTTGSDNTALGFQAGILATTGSNNVYIGSGISGVAGESNACYIASIFGQTSTNGVPVFINSNNKLGTATSSKRYKDAIKPMDKASETIFALKPVTFRYKKNLDPEGTPQFGLVAEEVQSVNPALVVRDKDGKPYSVRYDQVNAMLLNEFLKEHHKVQQQEGTIAELKSTILQQQKGIEALTSRLNELDAKIEKVSAQVEVSQKAARVANNL